MAQDRALEFLQRRARFDAELPDEQPAAVPVARERVRLPAAPVEREHQLPPQPLAEGLRLDEGLEIGDEPLVPAELEVGVGPLLERGEPELGQPTRGRPRERLLPELDQRRPAPEAERPAEELRAASRIARFGGGLGQGFEPREVELPRRRAKRVAGRPRLDPLRPERLPQLGHVDLEHLERARRDGLGPDRLDERLDRDHPAGVEEQPREERARLPGRKRHVGARVVDDLERAEQAELRHPTGIIRACGTASKRSSAKARPASSTAHGTSAASSSR